MLSSNSIMLQSNSFNSHSGGAMSSRNNGNGNISSNTSGLLPTSLIMFNDSLGDASLSLRYTGEVDENNQDDDQFDTCDDNYFNNQVFNNQNSDKCTSKLMMSNTFVKLESKDEDNSAINDLANINQANNNNNNSNSNNNQNDLFIYNNSNNRLKTNNRPLYIRNIQSQHLQNNNNNNNNSNNQQRNQQRLTRPNYMNELDEDNKIFIKSEFNIMPVNCNIDYDDDDETSRARMPQNDRTIASILLSHDEDDSEVIVRHQQQHHQHQHQQNFISNSYQLDNLSDSDNLITVNHLIEEDENDENYYGTSNDFESTANNGSNSNILENINSILINSNIGFVRKENNSTSEISNLLLNSVNTNLEPACSSIASSSSSSNPSSSSSSSELTSSGKKKRKSPAKLLATSKLFTNNTHKPSSSSSTTTTTSSINDTLTSILCSSQSENKQNYLINFVNDRENNFDQDDEKEEHSQAMLNTNKIRQSSTQVNKRQKLNQEHQLIDFCADPTNNNSSQFQLKVLCTGNFFFLLIFQAVTA